MDTHDLVRLVVLHAEQEVLSTDPPRVRITIGYEGDELALTFDETLSVVDVAGSE